MRARQQDAASAHLKAKFAKYVKRQRAEYEAPPLAVPVMSRDWPLYVPVRVVPGRAGADMHLQFRSRGV